MNQGTHYILLTRPHYCPSALIFLTPPRGIGWDCAAVECSPLAQGVNGREQGGGGKRATIRLQALSHRRFTGRLTLCICERAKWLGCREEKKATEVAIRCKSPPPPPQALTQRNGELLPLVTLYLDHTHP